MLQATSGTGARTITFFVPNRATYISAGTPWSDKMGPWTTSIGDFWDLNYNHQQYLTVLLAEL